MKDKVVIAISGGVDSSVAALLLKEQGHEVVGITMCLGVAAEEGGHTKCCGPREIEDARRVCQILEIPHYVMDFSGDLEEHIVRTFIEEYARGRTPNPCVACNRLIKFGTLLDKVTAMGFDFIATGHYARMEGKEGRSLARPGSTEGPDLFPACDQTGDAGSYPLSPGGPDERRGAADRPETGFPFPTSRKARTSVSSRRRVTALSFAPDRLK